MNQWTHMITVSPFFSSTWKLNVVLPRRSIDIHVHDTNERKTQRTWILLFNECACEMVFGEPSNYHTYCANRNRHPGWRMHAQDSSPAASGTEWHRHVVFANRLFIQPATNNHGFCICRCSGSVSTNRVGLNPFHIGTYMIFMCPCPKSISNISLLLNLNISRQCNKLLWTIYYCCSYYQLTIQ